MSDQPLCLSCGRPVADMAYLCDREAARLRVELERVALVAGEAMTTIARQSRTGGGGPRTEPEVPLPVNLSAAADHDAAVSTLTTWARHINESSGRVIPVARTVVCRHATCARARESRADGPMCAEAVPEHPLAVLTLWLATQVDWLRHRPEAEEAFDELADACRVLERVVDRAPERIVVGQCPCGTYLYAVRGAANVNCTACGTTYAVEETRTQLRRDLDQALFTAAEIASLVKYLGISEERAAIRHKINVWATRGVVTQHADIGGAPAYVFGEVVARLMAG